jgi:succinate dehydrogenase/fumarate reductase-like Fe-S protein
MDTFDIDRVHCGPMVLDALVKINDQIDPTLSFRRSCREGVCGKIGQHVEFPPPVSPTSETPSSAARVGPHDVRT